VADQDDSRYGENLRQYREAYPQLAAWARSRGYAIEPPPDEYPRPTAWIQRGSPSTAKASGLLQDRIRRRRARSWYWMPTTFEQKDLSRVKEKMESRGRYNDLGVDMLLQWDRVAGTRLVTNRRAITEGRQEYNSGDYLREVRGEPWFAVLGPEPENHAPDMVCWFDPRGISVSSGVRRRGLRGLGRYRGVLRIRWGPTSAVRRSFSTASGERSWWSAFQSALSPHAQGKGLSGLLRGLAPAAPDGRIPL